MPLRLPRILTSQVERWPRDRFFATTFYEYLTDPGRVIGEIEEFLGVEQLEDPLGGCNARLQQVGHRCDLGHRPGLLVGGGQIGEGIGERGGGEDGDPVSRRGAPAGRRGDGHSGSGGDQTVHWARV